MCLLYNILTVLARGIIACTRSCVFIVFTKVDSRLISMTREQDFYGPMERSTQRLRRCTCLALAIETPAERRRLDDGHARNSGFLKTKYSRHQRTQKKMSLYLQQDGLAESLVTRGETHSKGRCVPAVSDGCSLRRSVNVHGKC